MAEKSKSKPNNKKKSNFTLVRQTADNLAKSIQDNYSTCPVCKGSGASESDPLDDCKKCNGEGFIEKKK